MDFIPYKVNEVFENVFYQIPKELFLNPLYSNLSSDSKLLYGLLLDRLSVSMKNKWIDKYGNIYLIYSRKEAQKMLKLSDKPVTKAFKQLQEVKLIYEIRSGFRKNNIIYVGKINHTSIENTMTRIMSDSRNGDFTSQESKNVRCSNNKYNKNNYSKKAPLSKTFCNIEKSTFTAEDLEKLYEELEMKNFREVNKDDIIKILFEARDEKLGNNITDEDKKHEILLDIFTTKILKNVPSQNKKYVQKQFELLDDNLLDYLMYWYEKYYRNGFCDAFELLKGFMKNN